MDFGQHHDHPSGSVSQQTVPEMHHSSYSNDNYQQQQPCYEAEESSMTNSSQQQQQPMQCQAVASTIPQMPQQQNLTQMPNNQQNQSSQQSQIVQEQQQFMPRHNLQQNDQQDSRHMQVQQVRSNPQQFQQQPLQSQQQQQQQQQQLHNNHQQIQQSAMNQPQNQEFQQQNFNYNTQQHQSSEKDVQYHFSPVDDGNQAHRETMSSSTTASSTSSHYFNDQALPINPRLNGNGIVEQRMKSPIMRSPLVESSHIYQPQLDDAEQPEDSPAPEKVVSTGPQKIIRNLADLKVPELKHECKIRNIPVSGSKKDLMDRVKPYEVEICSQSELSRYTPYDARSHGKKDIFGNMVYSRANRHLQVPLPPSQRKHNLFQPIDSDSASVTDVDNSAEPSPQSSHSDAIQDYLQTKCDEVRPEGGGKIPCKKRTLAAKVNNQGTGKLDSNGQSQYLSFSSSNNPPQPTNLMRILTSDSSSLPQQQSAENHQQQQQINQDPPTSQQQQISSFGATAVPPTQFVQKTDNIFHFSQLESGGQFTLTNDSSTFAQNEATFASQYTGIQRTLSVQSSCSSSASTVGNNTVSQTLGAPNPVTNQSSSSFEPRFISDNSSIPSIGSSTSSGGNESRYPNQLFSSHIVQNQKMMLPPKLQDSPCAADLAGTSPSLPIAENISYHQDAQVFEENTSNSNGYFDLQTTQKLLSPQTLQLHEEMLKEQGRQIAELQRLLTENQHKLKEQQELILAAKKAQQEMRQKQNKSAMGQKSLKLIDLRSIQENHLQNMAKHHVQKHKFNIQNEENGRLNKTETRLVEEIHVGTAVEDIVRLIKQDARTALLIVSLLHKYRVERDEQNQTSGSAAPVDEIQNQNPPKEVAPRKPIIKTAVIHERFAPTIPRMKSPRPIMSKSQGNVDMEEIFKTVIHDGKGNESFKMLSPIPTQRTTDARDYYDPNPGLTTAQPDIIEIDPPKIRKHGVPSHSTAQQVQIKRKKTHMLPVSRSSHFATHSTTAPRNTTAHRQYQRRGPNTGHQSQTTNSFVSNSSANREANRQFSLLPVQTISQNSVKNQHPVQMQNTAQPTSQGQGMGIIRGTILQSSAQERYQVQQPVHQVSNHSNQQQQQSYQPDLEPAQKHLDVQQPQFQMHNNFESSSEQGAAHDVVAQEMSDHVESYGGQMQQATSSSSAVETQPNYNDDSDKSFDVFALDDGYPNIDAMVEAIKKKENRNSLETNLGCLANNLDQDDFPEKWLDNINRDINQRGEYEPCSSSSLSNERNASNDIFLADPVNTDWIGQFITDEDMFK